MSADRCTTHHHACDCREAAQQAELAAAQARIAEQANEISGQETVIGQLTADLDQAEYNLGEYKLIVNTAFNQRDAAQAQVAELSTQLVKAEHDWSAEMAEKEQAIEERDNYRTMAEKVAYVHVGLVMERDAALAQVQALRKLVESNIHSWSTQSSADGSGHGDIARNIQAALDRILAQSAPAAAERRVREQRVMSERYLRVTMPDGSRWDVPLGLVEQSYEDYYEDAASSDYELIDWAADNMNWTDVSDQAQRVNDSLPPSVDYQDGWVNGEKEIVTTALDGGAAPEEPAL